MDLCEFKVYIKSSRPVIACLKKREREGGKGLGRERETFATHKQNVIVYMYVYTVQCYTSKHFNGIFSNSEI